VQIRQAAGFGRFLPNASTIIDEIFRLLLTQKQPSILKSQKSCHQRLLASR